ncbi:FecCD family ABC transporter permease [Cohnella thailandensis]|uniref:Iron ABC transporter permease n=1 Tax=Cohnella thailandensis TaxID=557557 RepID=A0A841SU05_9BACL|nr:iron ABC transporter permease [Cohnella thailandensis]MBB6633698.1 iron ABC transporter permease [Cohnella thailandensis]MBP1976483.1 iron complex transport system permease protein [Cohnella thailandensis]
MRQGISRYRAPLLAGSILFLLAAFAASLLLGRTPVGWGDLVDSMLRYDPSVVEHIVIRTERLSRSLISVVVGACLSLAGALMQALSRNPLASTDLFGINAGAIFFVVFSALFLGFDSMLQLMGFAFLGATLAALAVFGIGSLGRGGMTPMKLVFAGSAIAALFASFTQAMLVTNESGLQDVLFWLAGSVSGRPLDNLIMALPLLAAAGLAAFLLGRSINVFAAGDEAARGLGQNTTLIKALLGVLIVVLAGGSVAIVGAIGFVGLVVPHLARAVAGRDYRWILPFSAVMGAVLLLLADIAARFVIMPKEVPIGVLTAAIGVPFFVHLARRGADRV